MSVERIIRVQVPKSLVDEAYEDGEPDAIMNAIIVDNSDTVKEAFLESGLIREGEDIKVIFVPDANLPSNSLSRPAKLVELTKALDGSVIDANTIYENLDVFENRDN
jgi:hypothetical protein